ncbi:WD40-repeat-containing domain protein [Lentinula raphanica]|uniref:WD40-repeat-containing domain protein n=1 Tax=Lentinula raphanica TaxID=153919 RepID=A0AA38U7D2_9AGAR|nr:WD40-repeat-containing domain protein [Lentinula raphanica]
MDSEYHQLSRLTGPRDAVLSLAFSAKAKFLSAAGYSGVFVWDLSNSTSVSTPLPHMLFAPQNPRYVITASAWIYFQKTKRHVLIIGSMRGDILLWEWTEEAKAFNLLYRVNPIDDSLDEILSIDIHDQDVASGRIGRVVASTSNRLVSVWTLTSSGGFSKVFTITLDDGLKPKTVRMCKTTRDIFVFPLYGGEIIRLDYKTGAVKSRKSPGPGRMGSVALNRASDKFVAYTGKNFQLYRLGNLEILKNFTAEAPAVLYPKQVIFGESERVIVGGTDRGCALVYDVESERVIQTLKYPAGSLVQPVSTYTLTGRHLVAIAGSTQEQPADVILFEKLVPQAATQDSLSLSDNPDAVKSVDVPGYNDRPVLIGFYIPKRLWKRIWITSSFLCLCMALYVAVPSNFAQVGLLLLFLYVLRSEAIFTDLC